MKLKCRLITFGLVITTLVIVGVWFEQNFANLITKFWFSSGILMVVLLSLVDQPFFSKDSNIFVNSITAILALFLVGVGDRDYIYFCFIILTLYLLISSLLLMFIRKNALYEENVFVQCLTRINRIIGKPNVLFSAFFLWGIAKQYGVGTVRFSVLIIIWTCLILLNSTDILTVINKSIYEVKKKSSESIGIVFGVQAHNSFLVKLNNNCREFDLFDIVLFKTSVNDTVKKGVIYDRMLLDQEQWIKVIVDESIEIAIEDGLDKNYAIENNVYLVRECMSSDFLNTFVGLVSEGSNIQKIKFIYNSKIEIYEGQLVELSVGKHKILYQIVQGITKVVQLENKNESSMIVGEAIQLGEWNCEKGVFEKFGWVPNINKPLFVASLIKDEIVNENEYIIGYIPNTNYPVIINKELAVTHHTAILGVTGAGKSVFARDLIRNIATDNTKIIIVDLTGEHKNCFQNIETIIRDEDAKKSFEAIEIIEFEKAKFANQQNRELIKGKEEEIKRSFYNSIKAFLQSDKNITIFELPDITNNASVLEYTRWFFYSLFKTAKAKGNFGKRICVVLEEAHTIVPELNSMGVSDFASKATVNSISQIALQGRKYNIGFIVIAQRTANVSKTVLTQCNSIISFQELDKTSGDFLSNYIGTDYVSALPTLKFRTAIAIGKAFRSTVPMIFEVREINEVVTVDNSFDGTDDLVAHNNEVDDTIEEVMLST